METVTIKAHTIDASQIEALKAFMKALKIKFELSKEQSTYSPEFVRKIQQGDDDLQQGKGRKITIEEFDSLGK